MNPVNETIQENSQMDREIIDRQDEVIAAQQEYIEQLEKSRDGYRRDVLRLAAQLYSARVRLQRYEQVSKLKN